MITAYRVIPLTKLIEQFERLPGIGKKSAQRLAFYVLAMPKEKAQQFADAIMEGRQGTDAEEAAAAEGNDTAVAEA